MSLKKPPFIPTPISVVRKALEISRCGPGDVLYDLGAGDGRVVIEAARMGAHAIAVEIEHDLVMLIRYKAEELGLRDRISVLEASFYDVYLGNATIVYQYLYPSINEALAPKLERELALGTRIITIDFPIKSWTPVLVKRIIDEAGIIRTIFLYIRGLSEPKASILSLKPICPKIIARQMGVRLDRDHGENTALG